MLYGIQSCVLCVCGAAADDVLNGGVCLCGVEFVRSFVCWVGFNWKATRMYLTHARAAAAAFRCV